MGVDSPAEEASTHRDRRTYAFASAIPVQAPGAPIHHDNRPRAGLSVATVGRRVCRRIHVHDGGRGGPSPMRNPDQHDGHGARTGSASRSTRTTPRVRTDSPQAYSASDNTSRTRSACREMDLLLVDVLQVPVDGAFGAPRCLGHVAHALALRQPHRHLSLSRRKLQGRGHHLRTDAMAASWLGDQHQRRHVPRSVVGLRDGHGLGVHGRTAAAATSGRPGSTR